MKTSVVRVAVPKSVRFEVLKRDKFVCQYCGAAAPQAVLQVDHIDPVSKGGSNEMVNLVTSCQPCNSGKSDRRISDDSALGKQRAQLEELQTRREQLEMMMEWRRSLQDMTKLEVDSVIEHWGKQYGVPGVDFHYKGGKSMYETMQRDAREWLKKFEYNEILDAIDTGISQYGMEVVARTGGEVFLKSWCWVGRILSSRKMAVENPVLSKLYYIRGIMRRRFHYVSEEQALILSKAALDRGATVEDIEFAAKTCHNWTSWERAVKELGAA